MFFMSEKANGWRNGILPAVMAAFPAGSVYAYPYFSDAFSTACCVSHQACSWIFSASIFFLGIGAAFFGRAVERNPRKSLFLASVLYFAGMSLTAAGLYAGSFWTVFAGYGVLNGVGQGLAYLSPVKAAMSWFPKSKGLAGSVSIVAFGLGSAGAIAVSRVVSGFGPVWTFASFAAAFSAMIAFAGVLLRKNQTADRASAAGVCEDGPSVFEAVSRRGFACAWLFMFLNILAGLVVIGGSAGILRTAGIASAAAVLSAAGFFNGWFRLVFAWISDRLKPRAGVWLVISCASAAVSAAALFHAPFLSAAAVIAVNACYGGCFSTLAPILSDMYGQTGLSRIHGLALSAWAAAALVSGFLSWIPPGSVFHVVLCLYAAGIFSALRVRAAFPAANHPGAV